MLKKRKTTSKVIEGITPEALGFLKAYPWPGNIRELQHVVERAVALVSEEMVRDPRPVSRTAGSALRPPLRTPPVNRDRKGED